MLSTRHQWFTCVHLSVTYLIRFFPDLFLSCSRPWLLTTAAEGDLRPAPVSWSRGAFLCSLISCSVAHRATSSARSALVAHSRLQIGYDFSMPKFTLRRDLRDAYRFPGFVPARIIRGVFGSPQARVVSLCVAN